MFHAGEELFSSLLLLQLLTGPVDDFAEPPSKRCDAFEPPVKFGLIGRFVEEGVAKECLAGLGARLNEFPLI